MIKNLLLAVLGTAAISASAQLNLAGDGYTLTNSSGTSNCYNAWGASNGGIMTHGSTIVQPTSGFYFPTQNGPLELVSKTTTNPASATWFSLPIITGTGDDAECTNFYNEDTGINMSSNGKVTITAEANEVGTVLEIYLGSLGQWAPETSTWWESNGTDGSILASHTFTTANTAETFTLDFDAIDATVWGAWTGKSKVQSIGYKSNTPTATILVAELKFGADSDTDDTDGTDGQSCTDVSDHGHGTWYTNLEDENHPQFTGKVKCSFERNDILGTKYGALDKGLLIDENGATPYCGMCVEATGDAGTAIIQIVDECPDCWDREFEGGPAIVGTNTEFGDIDLSPSAFTAVVGELDKGIGNFDWEEVSCPFTTPLHIIAQGSNQWGVKVIVGNHINRIKAVEVNQAGIWYSLVRGVDNGWTSYHLAEGTLNEVTKKFRITDIYDETIEVSGIDFSINPTNSQTDATGSVTNFSKCLVTADGNINSLDYVTVYPNPTNSTVVFDGVKEVQTIQILNLNGQVVASQSLNGNMERVGLDVSNLSAGIYVAKMTGNNSAGIVTFVKK